MTHKDIYTKFMIEYDKANVTSSYPSLTEYEAATVLDKAYNALIAQKVTGNNIRRVTFEGDLKNIEDLRALIVNKNASFKKDETIAQNVLSTDLDNDHLYFVDCSLDYEAKVSEPSETIVTSVEKILIKETRGIYDSTLDGISSGPYAFELPVIQNQSNEYTYDIEYSGEDTVFNYCMCTYMGSDLYGDDWNAGQVMQGSLDDVKSALFTANDEHNHLLVWPSNESATRYIMSLYQYRNIEREGIVYNKRPYDELIIRSLPIKLVNHQIAQKFFTSAFNMPWIKQPVCFMENKKLYIVFDLLNSPKLYDPLNPTTKHYEGHITYIKTPHLFVKDLDRMKELYGGNDPKVSYFDYKVNNESLDDAMNGYYKFECNDTVAEELISLAVAFALENVESQRLNSKLNMRGLEA